MIPLGGGYVYVPVTQFKTHVFKFSCDALGNATFSHVADTPDPNAYILGTGAATVTTMNAQDGTGLLWISDVQGYGLRIYDPIPPSNGGPLTSLRSFAIPGVTKFSHPVFGNGRVYISTNHGYLYGSGSPPVTIKCTALNQTAVQSISLPDATDFQISNVPALPFSVSIGQSFFFNGTFSPSNVGSLSRDVSMALQNPVSGYSSNSLVTLRATGRSAAHLLAISASSITFNVIANQIPSQQPALLWNLGDSSLTFTNFRFSLVSPTGPWIQPNTTSSGQMQVGDNFQQATSHHDACFFKRRASQFHHLSFTGTQPKAIVEFQTLDGSAWTKNLLFRLTNGGVPFAVPLSVAVSKPPYGIPGIIGKTNNIDLAEGSIVSAGNSQTVQMFCAVPKSQVNIPSYNGSTVWTLNTNDPDQGKLFVQLSCQAATEQVRPLLPNGTAQYGHTGYFMEGNPGRQLAVQVYTDAFNNTNTKCINTCSSLGSIFTETGFSSECWCGVTKPVSKGDDANCNYDCSGDVDRTCGGNGILKKHYLADFVLRLHKIQWKHHVASAAAYAIRRSIRLHRLLYRTFRQDCVYERDYFQYNDGRMLGRLERLADIGDYEYDDFHLHCSREPKQFDSYSITDPSIAVIFTYFGCFEDVPQRSLRARSVTNSSVSLDLCAAFCSGCNLPCAANRSQICGGNWGLSTYQLTPSYFGNPSPVKGFTSMGCYAEKPNARALKNVYYSDSMTTELCAARAAANGYSYIGLEYGRECVPELLGRQFHAIVRERLRGNVFFVSAVVGRHYGAANDSSHANQYNDLTPLGCWQDNAWRGQGRALRALPVLRSPNMTAALCASHCSQFAYFGLEYSSECWVGMILPRRPLPSARKADEINSAGRSSRTARRHLFPSAASPAPETRRRPVELSVASQSNTPPTRPSCQVDGTVPCLLSRGETAANMSVEGCVALAEVMQYAYAGLEYDNECWLGNALANTTANQWRPRATAISVALEPRGSDEGRVCLATGTFLGT
ncbi:hypothetical protein PMIN05_010418 [Paraphaeosphaeria minitans]